MEEGLTQSKSYLIDLGASNHMVSSKKSFMTLDIYGGSSIHMGDDSHILAVWKGSINIEHGEFQNVL